MIKKLVSTLSGLAIVFATMNLQACDTVQQMIQGTPTLTPTLTYTPTPTPTLTPTATITPSPMPTLTATLNQNAVIATQQFNDFFSWVEKFFNDGFISSVEGDYITLDDYSDSLAKSEYYRWATYENLEPRNFILQAKVKITNAAPNSTKAGCGFVYGYSGLPDLIIFSLDGNINYYSSSISHSSNYLDSKLFENPDGLILTLIIDEDAGGLRFFVNDRMGLNLEREGGHSMEIGPAVLSGNDEGYGTRCVFTDIVLWEIK